MLSKHKSMHPIWNYLSKDVRQNIELKCGAVNSERTEKKRKATTESQRANKKKKMTNSGAKIM